MKTLIRSSYLVFGFIFSLLMSSSILSCSDTDEVKELSRNADIKTRAVPTPYFDWENADWMPTPPMQSRISAPWTGQGSLAAIFGLDIVNDRKAFDGWELMYNTFDPNVTAPLINPYFVLYNKYRGIMRIYLYLTTQFIAPSSYIQDGITVISNHKTTLLNYLGTDRVDVNKEPNKQYMQMQPAPIDGSLPLASNRWYMMQYELAYDPSLVNVPYDEMQLSWTLNYYNVQKINLGGSVVGSLNGTIGSASGGNFFKSLTGLGKVVGTGVLAGVGKEVITKNTIDIGTGKNNLGLGNQIFKDLSKGVSSALSAATGNFPGAIIGLLNAVVGGSSATPTPISMTLKADIKLEGTGTESGAFPSSPSSFWVPGTIFSSNSTGFIPLYNKSLGVVYLREKPTMIINEYEEEIYEELDPYGGHDILLVHSYWGIIPQNLDYSNLLIINPEVERIANVEILKQEIVNSRGIIGATREAYGYANSWATRPTITDQAVRFVIRISPKDGAPSSIIIKTFDINIEYDLDI